MKAFRIQDQDLIHHMKPIKKHDDPHAMRWYGNLETMQVALGSESEARRILDVPIFKDIVPLTYDHTEAN